MPPPQNPCYNCFINRPAESPGRVGPCPYCGYHHAESAAKYPLALRAGSILYGRYIVGRVLGQGGFGVTYLALDYTRGVKVAVKEYLPDGMATRLPGASLVSVFGGEKAEHFYYGAESFLDEARLLSKFIGNRNIVGVTCYFIENNTAYFVMDYIEGISFKNYIRNRGGRVDYRTVLRVLVPVLSALSAVHREGFIHRDLTPDNIYITQDSVIKILDFGSARYSLGDKSRSLEVILKAGYAPKEQYTRRGRQGPYTDVYSVAACFYASITGFLPPEALERAEEDELKPFSARGIGIPHWLEAAIYRGLAVRAEDRFQSAEEFLAAIEAGQLGDAVESSRYAQLEGLIAAPAGSQAAPAPRAVAASQAAAAPRAAPAQPPQSMPPPVQPIPPSMQPMPPAAQPIPKKARRRWFSRRRRPPR